MEMFRLKITVIHFNQKCHVILGARRVKVPRSWEQT